MKAAARKTVAIYPVVVLDEALIFISPHGVNDAYPTSLVQHRWHAHPWQHRGNVQWIERQIGSGLGGAVVVTNRVVDEQGGVEILMDPCFLGFGHIRIGID